MEIAISIKIGFPHYFQLKIHAISIVRILKTFPVNYAFFIAGISLFFLMEFMMESTKYI